MDRPRPENEPLLNIKFLKPKAVHFQA
jgi:hypothetical protein